MAERDTSGPGIAVASSGLGHVARGIESWAADTARALDELGADVTLFRGSGRASAPYERVCPCVRRGGPLNGTLEKVLPAPFWRVGLGSAYGIEQMSFALNLVPRLAPRIGVVHTQDPLVALTLQRAHALGLVRAATVLAHGTEEPFSFLKKIDYVQHLAPFHLEEARREGCYKPGWTAIGNFVDTEVFHPGPDPVVRQQLGIAPGAFVVLSVAAVKKSHKRVDYLIREVATLRRGTPTEVVLLVAGARTEQTRGLLALAREFLGRSAFFLLDQPRERMPAVYRAADVFALCSLKEMMPIALLEAGASGLPCLVSRHPVVNWMAGPGGEGVEMERPGALAGALRAYLHKGYREGRGEAARRHTVENFAKEVIVQQYLAMYQGRGGPGAGEGARMSERPLVSVVMPAYNAEAFVADAIDSVLAQDYRPIEVLVVDDGSTDATAAVVQRYGEPVRCLSQANAGPAGARNLALEHATGRYIAFLDADDVWHPHKLAVQVPMMEANPAVGICGAQVKGFRSVPDLAWEDAPADTAWTPVDAADVIIRNRFRTSTVLARAEAVRQAGGFDADIFGPEDWDLWRRITQRWPGMSMRTVLAGYRERDESVSSNARRMLENNRKVLRKAFADNPGLPLRCRLKALGYLHLDATQEYLGGSAPAAAWHLALSAALWPLPFGRDCCSTLARAKLAVRLPLQMLGLWRRDREVRDRRPQSTAPPVEETNER